MRISVKDCLKLDALKGCKVLTCKEETSRRVRTISVLDEVDLEMGVERNAAAEHMVVTHFWAEAYDVPAQVKAVKEMGERNVSALVVYLHERGVKEVAAEVIEAAEEVKLPLITLKDSGKVSYSKLIEEVYEKVLFGENLSDNLLNNTMYHLLNFEKHSSFPIALREAALRNNYQIVLMTEEYNTILTVETRHLVKIEDAVLAARQLDAFSNLGFTKVDIESIITYWGYINIQNKKYILVIVDNEDEYSASEMTRLAQTIEVAISMWKYTPDRDSRAEFIKSAVRGDLAFCHTLLDESGLRGMQFTCAFHIKDVEKKEDEFLSRLSVLKRDMGLGLLTTSDDGEIFGIVYIEEGQDKGVAAKNACINLFEELKAFKKDARIFHVTGMKTLESCVDAFKMITRTSGYMSKVFPFKRVFTKYEIAIVYDCVYMQDSGQSQYKMYLELLEPFQREVSQSKGKMLIETLSTFVLDAGMNSGRTAKFMNIHNNTVQYRLKKANEILGAEMTANRIIPGLTMALALNRLEEE